MAAGTEVVVTKDANILVAVLNTPGIFQKSAVTNIQDRNNIVDPEDGNLVEARLFCAFPQEIETALRGTAVLPNQLCETTGVRAEEVDAKVNQMLSTERSDGAPLVEIENEHLRLNVWGGSFSDSAMTLSDLALKLLESNPAEGDDAETLQEKEDMKRDLRLQYMIELAKIQTPIAEHKSPVDPDIWIREDCIASGVSIIEELLLLEHDGFKFSDEGGKAKTIRIDVATTTAQAVLALQKLAEIKGFKLEINAGHLAWGLSAGTEQKAQAPSGQDYTVFTHSNYLIYPPELFNFIQMKGCMGLEARIAQLQQLSFFGDIYVVGDMGDATESLPASYDQRLAPNRYRFDTHGERNSGTHRLRNRKIDFNKKLILYFPNGGYFPAALYQHLEVDKQRKQTQTRFVRLKRHFLPELGYGVSAKAPQEKVAVAEA